MGLRIQLVNIVGLPFNKIAGKMYQNTDLITKYQEETGKPYKVEQKIIIQPFNNGHQVQSFNNNQLYSSIEKYIDSIGLKLCGD